MSSTSLQHGASPSAHSADDRAANSDTVPARVGVRTQWLRYWPAAAGGGVVLAAMIGLVLVNRAPDAEAVQQGRLFSAVERRKATETLRRAGIEATTTRSGQLLVRPADLPASNAALKQAGADESAGSRAPAGSWLDTFSTSRQQQAAADTSHAARLGRLLQELPGVAEAEVVWDEEPRVGRRQAPRVRATVFLKPEPGCVVGLDTVQAVRAAVAGSRAYLAAQDVVVMDLERRVTYGTESDPAAFAAEVQRAELLATCRSRIETALADFSGVRVVLDVEGSVLPVAEPPTVDAQPVRPVGRARIAGVSGPNLRLEVSPEPPLRLAADDREGPLVAAMPVQLPHLVVSVVLPGDQSNHRVAGTGDIRERIASAVAGLPVTLSPVRLSVTVPTAETEAMPPVRAGANGPNLAGAWLIVARLAAMPIVHRAAAVVLLVVVLMAAVRRFRGRRRRSAGIPSTVVLLPGREAAAWAPLVAQEPSAVVAGLLRHLSADDVSQVLAELTPARQGEVLELAPTASLSVAQLADVRRRIRMGLATVDAAGARRPAATQPVVRRRAAPKDAAAVFDDLVRVDDESLRELASRVHDATWSAALMGAAPKLQRRMSKVRASIGDSADAGERRPMRLREIESAQRTILDAWQILHVGG